MEYSAKAARKCAKFTVIPVFLLLLIILCAAIFFHSLNHYKHFFEKIASEAIHQPVAIGKIEGSWHGLTPMIKLDNVTLYDPTHRTKQLQVQQLQFNLNLLKSLIHWQLTPDKIYLSGATLSIQQLSINSWAINGIKIQPQSKTSGHTLENILTQLNNQGQINLDHVDVTLKTKEGIEATIANLKLLLTPNLHTINLDTGHIQVVSPHFSQTLAFDHLKLGILWMLTAQGPTISVKDLLLTNMDLKLRTTFRLDLYPANNNSPYLKLFADFSEKKISNIPKYIPKGIFSEKFSAWLSTALAKGGSVHGKVLLHGPLHHFPFGDHTGRFRAWMQIENADLHYLPNWPDLTHTQANLKFDNTSLQADVVNAQVLGINTYAMHAEIPDLHNPILKLHWNSNAHYSDLSRFVFGSPLSHVLGNILKYFNYVGPTHFTIDLNIPLHNSKEIEASGNYVFMPEGTLKIPAYKIILNKVHGALQFTQNSINAKDIKGQWLGQPTFINIVTQHKNSLTNGATPPLDEVEQQKNNNVDTDINIAGNLSIPDAIKNYKLNFLSSMLSGTTQYKAMLKFSKLNNINHTLIVFNSNLAGVNVNLPEPLKKSALEITPTEIKLESSGKGFHIILNYDKKLSAALALQNNAQKLSIYGGDIELGSRPAKLSNAPGLVIGGKIPSLNLSDLGKYFTPGTSAAAGKGQANPPQLSGLKAFNLKSLNLSFDKLSAFGITVNKIVIQAKQTIDSLLININSADILGEISIPFDLSSNKFIKANFQRVYLTSPVVNTAAKNSVANKNLNKLGDINPEQIPSLDLIFNNVYYNQRALGQICLLTLRQKNAMQITRFSVDFPLFRFFAAGHWRSVNGKSTTILSGNVKTSNLGTLLSDWNLTKSLKGAKGSGSFVLGWPGLLYQPDLHKLNGKFSFAFEKGEVLNVINNQAEAGIGKILNLLTIQSLQNLLLKPFSLLTPKTGFDFSDLTGDFTVTNGNAESQNVIIKGDLAKVESKGRIGLGARDYDLLVKVTPLLTNSFAGASAFIAGPVIGGAVWLANKVIGGILNSFFSMTYHVTGGWSHPSFKKI